MAKPIIQINGVVREMTDAEYQDWLERLEIQRPLLAAQVRADRNDRLAACDWTQLPDSPVDGQAWLAYRQALRDLTKQAGFPQTVEWPAAPV